MNITAFALGLLFSLCLFVPFADATCLDDTHVYSGYGQYCYTAADDTYTLFYINYGADYTEYIYSHRLGGTCRHYTHRDYHCNGFDVGLEPDFCQPDLQSTCDTTWPDVPETCSDGLLTSGETGVDCGGACPDPCVWRCPDGFTLINDVCMNISDSLQSFEGQCPDGYSLDPDFPSTCLLTGSQILASANVPELDPLEFGIMPYNPTIQTSTSETSTSSVDNGNGTTTDTSVTTVNNPDGTTSVTTTEKIVNISTDTIISASVSTEEEQGWFEEDGVIDTGLYTNQLEAGVYDSEIDPGMMPEKENVTGIMDAFVESSPFFAVLNTFEVRTADPVCSIDVPVPIYDKTITFSLCRWQDFLQSVGAMILSITMAYGVLIVYRGWK